MLELNDIGARLGFAGLASMLVVGVNGDNLDATADVGGSARIWSDPRDGRAPAGQSIAGVRAEIFSQHLDAQVAGLRHGGDFRTNAGIVNLSAAAHQLTIQISGEHASGQFKAGIAPFAMLQVPLPDVHYGMLSLYIFTDDPNTVWLAYASSIDATTGDAATVIASRQ